MSKGNRLMTFDQWLNEIEGFSLRIERIYDDLIQKPKDLIDFDNWKQIKIWLEAAYNAGVDSGYADGYDDGYEIGNDL